MVFGNAAGEVRAFDAVSGRAAWQQLPRDNSYYVRSLSTGSDAQGGPLVYASLALKSTQSSPSDRFTSVTDTHAS